MIIRTKAGLPELFFILRGSIIQTITKKLLLIAAVAEAVAALHAWRPEWMHNIPLAPFTLLGLSLSIFLSFRNNACYERWWEARKLLGQLVVEARSLARDTMVLLPVEEEVLRWNVIRRAIGFSHALAARLRGKDAVAAAREWLPAGEGEALAQKRNVPNAILQQATAEIGGCLRDGKMSDILYTVFEGRLSALCAIQTGCERILVTPLPFAYSLLLHRTAVLFCLLLPSALVDSFGWFTALPAVLVAYPFFGLDALGDELEEPFGLSENDLPLDAIVRTVEIDLLEALGEKDLPPPLVPVNYLLQ
jgi:putative membrane protein